MNINVLAYVAGIAWVQQWSRLPNAMEWAVMLVLLLLLGFLRWRPGGFLLLGSLWAALYGQWRVAEILPDAWQRKDVVVEGYINILPKTEAERASFDLIVSRAPTGIPSSLKLNWYSPPARLKAGQTYQLTVRLKKPHGLINPGTFDYQAWLFAHRIGATGYVRTKPPPRLIEPEFSLGWSLAQWRQRIADNLERVAAGSEWAGVIQALAIGSQQAISQDQWQLFRRTGIVHLMVISGAHISLVAGLVFMLARWLWARSGVLWLSPQNVAASLAWCAALLYAGLAGFTIPTQRAMLMLSVGLICQVWQRHSSSSRMLALALLAVVTFDPLAVISAGFWLSFAAVALLFYISAGRLFNSGFWRRSGRVHLAMAVGLAPLLIVFFQQVSLVAPLANWLAVPVVGLLVTPLALLTALSSSISFDLSDWCFAAAEWVLQYLHVLLAQLAAWPLATLNFPQPNALSLLLAGLGILLALAPSGMPGRYLSPILLLPLLFPVIDKPKPGQVWLTALDVGQGLAVVVETANHVLVYDAGPRYGQFDLGEAVLLPFLGQRNIRAVDALLISHDENDHSGGAAALMVGLPVRRLYSSATAWAELPGGGYCRAGQSWQWDGVSFSMLSPESDFAKPNDNSCVLKIDMPGHSVLLTGDIEQAAERWLTVRYGSALASSVLIAPHHGSNTSSHGYFLDQVSPQWALISAGYLNRFGFPHAKVLQRYRQRHIRYWTTAQQGAIRVEMGTGDLNLSSARQQGWRYWMLVEESDGDGTN